MDEIQSTGGYLMCVERRFADQWRGIDGLSIKLDPSMTGVTTDYERACRIPNQYLCVLCLKHGTALILGDGPLITGVWKNSLNQVVIWRIFCAEPDDDIPGLLASLSEKSFSTSLQSIEFSFDSPNVVIFDTSLPGDEAEAESIAFDIAPGKYLVTTHHVRPYRRTELLLHRFYPIT